MIDSALTEQPHPELEAQSTTLPDLVSSNGSSFEVEHPDDSNPLRWGGVLEDSKIDTIPYPYIRYNEEAEVEAHVHTFLTTPGYDRCRCIENCRSSGCHLKDK